MGLIGALLLAGLGIGLYFLIKALTGSSGSPTPFENVASNALKNIEALGDPDKLKEAAQRIE